MSTSKSNQNLLFGVVALQLDFITREQFVAATSVWLTNQSKPIEQILLQQSAITNVEQSLIAPLIERHIENHDGDANKSLAVLTGKRSLEAQLQSVDDASGAATLQIVAGARESIKISAGSDTTAEEHEQTLQLGATTADASRFRILRPHAKGGLGEVSIAQDIELNREVALKEIREQYAHDLDSRARFVLEAEVTGGLEHPGIVPVYGLGHYADGRPYYAMRFIRGASLKEAVDRFHRSDQADVSEDSDSVTNNNGSLLGSLAFRKLLGRFVDVCNAIEYAHSRGVLHRDLKPDNIMLGKYGEALVVDWGLAKLQGRDEKTKVDTEITLTASSESGSAPTQMGNAIGTPAFMPPEQAAGRLNELGPASDVYSLGATLYYVLTGSPPISGDDLGEILRKVQAGDFVQPRAMKHDIPRELEAICLRAMATRPTDRYASPQTLADDLERFLGDEPVTAYVEPLAARVRRWSRNHPKSVASLAATFLVGLTSAIVVSAIVSGKNHQLASANSELVVANSAEQLAKQEAEEKRAEAESSREQERLAKEAAEERRLEAEANAAIANRQRNLAMDSLSTLIEDVQAQLTDASTHELKEKLLQTAMQGLAEISEKMEAGESSDSDVMMARARLRLGETYMQLGKTDAARKEFQLAHDLVARWENESGASGPWRTSVEILHRLGDVAKQTEDALAYYQAASEIAEQRSDADVRTRVRCHEKLGDGRLANGQAEKAVQAYEQALALDTDKHDDADSEQRRLLNLSSLHVKLGDAQQAAGQVLASINTYSVARGILTKLGAADSSAPDVRKALARTYERSSQASDPIWNLVGEAQNYQNALDIYLALELADPQNAERILDVARLQTELGEFALHQGEFGLATAYLGVAAMKYENLATIDPNNRAYQKLQANALSLRGDACYARGGMLGAHRYYNQSLQLILPRQDELPQLGIYDQFLARHVVGQLARVNAKLGDEKTAAEFQSQRAAMPALEASFESASVGRELLDTCLDFVNRKLVVGDSNAALAHGYIVEKTAERLFSEASIAPQQFALVLTMLGDAYLRDSQLALAQRNFERVLEASNATQVTLLATAGLALCAENNADFIEAQEHWQKISELLASIPETEDDTSQIAEQMKVFAESKSRLANVVLGALKSPPASPSELPDDVESWASIAIAAARQLQPATFEHAVARMNVDDSSDATQLAQQCLLYSRAAEAFQKADGSGNDTDRKQLAAEYTDKAVASLQAALKQGFNDWQALASNPYLGPVRQSEWYRTWQGVQQVSLNSIGMTFARVPAGSFVRGSRASAEQVGAIYRESPALFEGEHPKATVEISKPFLLSATEVTVGQFRRFVDETKYVTDAEKQLGGGGIFIPGMATAATGDVRTWTNTRLNYIGDDHPVVFVSWNDATAFCDWLSKSEGVRYRLPTEAEWEYACRAGTETKYYTGDDPESLVLAANIPDLAFRSMFQVAYESINGNDGHAGLAPVGEFRPNRFGLYDMHGNTWEWCLDVFEKSYYSRREPVDPTGPDGQGLASYRIGVQLKELLTAEQKKGLGLGERNGVLITFVQSNSVAADAGMLVNDVLMKVGDHVISRLQELPEAFKKSNGQAVEVTYLRDGKQHSVKIVPEEMLPRVIRGGCYM